MGFALQAIVGSCTIAAASGVPGLLLPRRSPLGQFVAAVLMVFGSSAGLCYTLYALSQGTTDTMTLPGILPDWAFQLKLDPLSAFFLAPIFLMGITGPVYGLRYWRQNEHPRNGRKLSFCYGLLVAALGLVAVAADSVTFLFAWEVMALSAFFLVSTEDHKPETRRAGWVYLVAAHVGTLILFGLFAVLRMASGSFDLRRLQPADGGPGLQIVIFLVALAGFGLKAGMMPLHFWLPGAHASAPSHVSAMLSGVLLKIGVYGLLRTLTLLSLLPVACGVLVLALGAVSAVFGVVFALGQHDLKRLLAYHSIENIGIINMGLGLAMIGSATHTPELFVLGLAGCLLHVWNHGLFKSLLFLAAGSVVHAVDTREIDHLGGLAKLMPQTAAFFFVGAVAICGLPPLNGFVSEFMIYLGLFRAATDSHGWFVGVAFAAPVLAMVGALAVACFVKAFGAAFLGAPRTAEASRTHESPIIMLAPMALLASMCAAIGLFPFLVIPALERVLAMWPGFTGPRLGELVPRVWLTAEAGVIVLGVAIGAILLRRMLRRTPAPASVTWDCGYAQPHSRMQYTSASFAATLVGLFRWVLRPVIQQAAPTGLFPHRSAFESHVPDVVLEGLLSPFWRRVKGGLASLRVLHQGRVQQYLLYVLLALFGLLLSLVPVGELIRKLVSNW